MYEYGGICMLLRCALVEFVEVSVGCHLVVDVLELEVLEDFEVEFGLVELRFWSFGCKRFVLG